MGSTEQNVSALLLRFSTDKASLAEAQNALVSLQQSQEELTAAQAAGNSQAAITAMRQQADAQYQLSQAIDEVIQATQKAVQITEEEAAAFEKVFDASLKAADAQKETAQAQNSGTSARSSGRAAAQLFGALDLGPLSQSARLLTDVAVAGTELNPVMLAVTAAAIPLSAAMQGVSKALEDTKAKAQAFFQAQATPAELIANGATSQQAKVQAAQAQAQQTAAQSQIAFFQGFIDQFNKLKDERGATIAAGLVDAALSQATNGQVTSITAVINQVDQLKQTANTAGQQFDALNNALQSGAFKANDVAAAEKQAAAERAQAILQTAQSAAQAKQEDLQLSQGTLKNAQDRAAAYLQEYQAAQASLKVLIASGDMSKEVSDQIAAKQNEVANAMQRYGDIMDNVIPPLEAAQQAEDQLAQARQRALVYSGEMTKAQEDAAKADADYVKAVQATADGTIKATDDLNKATSAALSALNTSIASAQQQADDALNQANRQASDAKADALQNAEDARTDAQIKAQQARLQAEADYQRNVRDIERRFQDSSENAIQDRDAVALDAARTTRKNELQQASEDYQAKLKAIDSDLKEQNRLIDRRYKEQIAQIDRRLQEQKADIDRRLQEQVQAAEQKYQQAVDAAKAAYDKQLADLQTKLTQEQAIRDAADANALAAINNFVTAAQNKWNSLPGNSGSTTTTTTTGSTGTQNEWGGGGYEGGGSPPMFQPFQMNERGIEAVKVGNRTYAVLTKPGRVYSADQTAAMMGGGGFNYSPVINAPNWRGIEKQVVRHLRAFIRGNAETYGRN